MKTVYFVYLNQSVYADNIFESKLDALEFVMKMGARSYRIETM